MKVGGGRCVCVGLRVSITELGKYICHRRQPKYRFLPKTIIFCIGPYSGHRSTKNICLVWP